MTIGISLGLNLSGRGASAPAITGTAPTLSQTITGNDLSDHVTWGSATAPDGETLTGASPVREMDINGAGWVAYVGTTTLADLETAQVRETWAVVGDTVPAKIFNSVERTNVYAAPTITGTIPSVSWVVGSAITAIDLSTVVTGDGLTYGGTGYPGVTVNASTGEVTGTPTLEGTVNTSFTVTNSSGVVRTIPITGSAVLNPLSFVSVALDGSGNIVVTYNRAIFPGTSGNIVLRRFNGTSFTTVKAYNVATAIGTDPGEINFTGSTFVLHPVTALDAGTLYAVRVGFETVQDAGGIFAPTIGNDTTITIETPNVAETSVVISGLTTTDFGGIHAQDGVELTATPTGFVGGETFTYNWRTTLSATSLGTASTFTPDADALDLEGIYCEVTPSVGDQVDSAAYTVRYPPGQNITLTPVVKDQGLGTVVISLAPLTGTRNAVYDASAYTWITVGPDLEDEGTDGPDFMRIEDVVVDEVAVFTGSNSGGSFVVTQAATITANPFSLVSITPTTGAVNVSLEDPEVVWTFNRDVFAGSGQIRVYEDTGSGLVQVGSNISVTTDQGTGPGQVDFTDATLTLNLSGFVEASKAYEVQLQTNNVQDAVGRPLDEAAFATFSMEAGFAPAVNLEGDYTLTIEADPTLGTVDLVLTVDAVEVFNGSISQAQYEAQSHNLVAPVISIDGSTVSLDTAGVWLYDPAATLTPTYDILADGISTGETTFPFDASAYPGEEITVVETFGSGSPATSNAVDAPASGITRIDIGHFSYVGSSTTTPSVTVNLSSLQAGDTLLVTVGAASYFSDLTVSTGAGTVTKRTTDISGDANGSRIGAFTAVMSGAGSATTTLTATAAGNQSNVTFTVVAFRGGGYAGIAHALNNNGQFADLPLTPTEATNLIFVSAIGEEANFAGSFPTYEEVTAITTGPLAKAVDTGNGSQGAGCAEVVNAPSDVELAVSVRGSQSSGDNYGAVAVLIQ